MGLAAIEVTGTEKQGLGYCLIVDGKIWPAKINDPGTITFTRNRLDTTHSKTLDFKQNKPEELAEALEQALTTFFDPTLAEAFDIMTTDGAVQIREIYLMFPLVPLLVGEPIRENGFIFLPQGYIAADSVAMPLDNYMTQPITVNGGTANPTLSREQDVTAAMAPATVINFTPVELSSAALFKGDVVGVLTTNIVPSVDVSLYFNLGGADVADFELDGKFLLAAVDNPAAAAKVLDITTSNLVGFNENELALQYIEVGLGFTIIA